MNACRRTLMKKTAGYLRPMRPWLSVAAVSQRLRRARLLRRRPFDAAFQELNGSRPTATDGRVRRQGGGAKTVTERQPGLREALLD